MFDYAKMFDLSGRRALVIGGGIAGIQSALDLANSGYKVYMVEKSASIGGNSPLLIGRGNRSAGAKIFRC